MEELIKTTDVRAKTLVQAFQNEVAGFRTNRPTPQLIEDIKVEYAGHMLPLKQVGSISVVPPRELQVHVWDATAIPATAKAIEATQRGLNPSVQGNMIRVMLPPMSDERREELSRLVKTTAEKFRIQIRGLRDESNKKVELAAKAKEVSEDKKFALRERVQKTIDGANKEIENIIARKLAEISE